jgi:hypothetical protein
VGAYHVQAGQRIVVYINCPPPNPSLTTTATSAAFTDTVTLIPMADQPYAAGEATIANVHPGVYRVSGSCSNAPNVRPGHLTVVAAPASGPPTEKPSEPVSSAQPATPVTRTPSFTG